MPVFHSTTSSPQPFGNTGRARPSVPADHGSAAHLGDQAVLYETLIHLLQGEMPEERHVILEPQLLVWESCGAAVQ